MRRRHTIYGVTDEYGQIRYVGQTMDCVSRFKSHVKRFQSLFVVTGLALLQVETNHWEANAAETKWVKFFGRDNLFNGNDGGQSGIRGCPMPPAELQLNRYFNLLTQRQLAKKLHVSITTISRWERGLVVIPSSVKQFFYGERR